MFNKIIKSSLYNFCAVSLVMVFAIIESYTYIFGWIVGSLQSFTGFSLSFMIMEKFSLFNKSKKQGFGFGFLKTIIILIYHTVFLIFVMSVNIYFSENQIFSFNMQSIINPINFYTYLFGIGLIPISTIIWGLISIWKEKNAKVYRCN